VDRDANLGGCCSEFYRGVIRINHLDHRFSFKALLIRPESPWRCWYSALGERLWEEMACPECGSVSALEFGGRPG
jgi:hypothetical protein